MKSDSVIQLSIRQLWEVCASTGSENLPSGSKKFQSKLTQLAIALHEAKGGFAQNGSLWRSTSTFNSQKQPRAYPWCQYCRFNLIPTVRN